MALDKNLLLLFIHTVIIIVSATWVSSSVINDHEGKAFEKRSWKPDPGGKTISQIPRSLTMTISSDDPLKATEAPPLQPDPSSSEEDEHKEVHIQQKPVEVEKHDHLGHKKPHRVNNNKKGSVLQAEYTSNIEITGTRNFMVLGDDQNDSKNNSENLMSNPEHFLSSLSTLTSLVPMSPLHAKHTVHEEFRIRKVNNDGSKADSSEEMKDDDPRLSKLKGNIDITYQSGDMSEPNKKASSSEEENDTSVEKKPSPLKNSDDVSQSVKFISSEHSDGSNPISAITNLISAEVTPSPVTEVTSSPFTEVTSSPFTEVTSSPVTEVTSSPFTEVTSSPVTEVTSSPFTEVTSSPVAEVTPSPVTEVTQSSVTEATSIQNPNMESTESSEDYSLEWPETEKPNESSLASSPKSDEVTEFSLSTTEVYPEVVYKEPKVYPITESFSAESTGNEVSKPSYPVESNEQAKPSDEDKVPPLAMGNNFADENGHIKSHSHKHKAPKMSRKKSKSHKKHKNKSHKKNKRGHGHHHGLKKHVIIY